MVRCGVLFEVRTELLNNIYTGFGFKGLTVIHQIENFIYISIVRPVRVEGY
jgi:hypothetical protein